MAYLDDVIIPSKTIAHVLMGLEAVLKAMCKAKLKLHPKKCRLSQRKLEFLGYIVSADRIEACPKTVEKVRNWARLVDQKEVNPFLGFCQYYSRFIKNFAEPLYRLTEKDRPFTWPSEAENDYQKLKYSFSAPPVLSYPISSGPPVTTLQAEINKNENDMILDCDPSLHAAGETLSQIQRGEERVLAYWSHAFSKQEGNYCVTRRDCLLYTSDAADE